MSSLEHSWALPARRVLIVGLLLYTLLTSYSPRSRGY